MKNSRKEKIKDFFRPHRLGFHILLAIGITLVIAITTLFLLGIYTDHGKEIEMPNFIGKDANQLVSDSLSDDFIIEVTESIFDKKMPPGSVLKQDPHPHEMVKKGRKVYLTIASDLPPKIKMPQLIDVSLRQAEIMLKAKGLELGSVIYKASPYENVVLEQLYRGRPISPETEISMGESITLVVGRDIESMMLDSLTQIVTEP